MSRALVIALAVTTVLAALAYSVRFAGWDEAESPACVADCG
jgi:hypothetical protein